MSEIRPPAPATPWRLLALLMAMTALGPVALNILMPAVPGLALLLITDAGTVQLTVSLFLLSLAAGQLLMGPLSDRFGRRPVALAGLALASAASLAAIFAASIDALIAVRIVQAAGAATGVVIGRAIIRDLFERDRAAAMIGLVTTAMVVAPMVSPLIGGVLDTAFGWESIFLFVTLLNTGVLIWAAMTLPETRAALGTGGTQSQLLHEWRALFTSARFHGYVLCAALGTAPFFIFLGGGPHVVVTMMERTSAEYGMWFALTSLGYMSGNFTVVRLSQRFGIDAMIVAGLAIEVVGALIVTLLILTVPDGGPALVFVPQVLISYGNGVLLPNAIAGAVSVRPHAAGAASGITGFVQMTVGAIATQFISHVLAGAATPLPISLAMIAASAAAMVAFFTLVKAR